MLAGMGYTNVQSLAVTAGSQTHACSKRQHLSNGTVAGYAAMRETQ